MTEFHLHVATICITIEEEAQIESAHDTDTAPIRDARTRLRGSVLRYDDPLEPVLDGTDQV